MQFDATISRKNPPTFGQGEEILIITWIPGQSLSVDRKFLHTIEPAKWTLAVRGARSNAREESVPIN